MKKIRVFNINDEIPSNAKFIHLERVALGHTGKTKLELYYEIPVTEQTKREDKHKEAIEAIVAYLNSTTGGRYTSKSKATVSLIRARLNEDYTLDDFKKVIDRKCAEWLDDPRMSGYLRPQTLFGNKFAGYLSGETAEEKETAVFNQIESIFDNEE